MSRTLITGGALFLVWLLAAAQEAELRDPMRPFSPSASRAASVEQRYRVSATLVSDARRVAVINGRPVGVGDEVDGAKLMAVQATSVELRVGSRTFTVSLSRRTDD